LLVTNSLITVSLGPVLDINAQIYLRTLELSNKTSRNHFYFRPELQYSKFKAKGDILYERNCFLRTTTNCW